MKAYELFIERLKREGKLEEYRKRYEEMKKKLDSNKD